jgi:hypothetical protein
MKKMKPKVQKLWCGALKGKRYKQGRNALRIKNKAGKSRYCCLGVLCDLYRRATGRGKWVLVTSKKYWAFKVGKHIEDSVLPTEVANWAGLLDLNPNVGIDSCLHGCTSTSLSNLNDGDTWALGNKRYSFAEIADRIESSL